MAWARLALVPAAVAVNLAFLYVIVRNAPGEAGLLYFPSSLEDIRSLAGVLGVYRQLHPQYVLLLFSSAYLFKQTFAVPGSVFLNVLAGAIFGSHSGFVLCCLLTACGASLCFFLARLVGERAVAAWFPEKLESFKLRLEENKAELPFFLLFLRLFPMSPNWALNMASGVLGVPIHLFFFSVLFGLMPYNYLCVTSGAILSEINDLGDVVSWSNMARCASAALATLLPTLLLRTRKVLKDPSPGEHSDLLPKDQEHAYSSASEQRKEPCDNSTSEDLREEDTFRVPGVVDGKS